METGFWSIKCTMSSNSGITVFQPWTKETTYIFTLQNGTHLSCRDALMLCKTLLWHMLALSFWGWLSAVPCFLALAGWGGGGLAEGCPLLLSSWIISIRKPFLAHALDLTAHDILHIISCVEMPEKSVPAQLAGGYWVSSEIKKKYPLCSSQVVNGLRLQFRA